MTRSSPSIFRREFGVIYRMSVESIKADQRSVGRRHYKEADIVGLRELVGGFLEVIINLLDTTRKSRSIVRGGIERLNDVSGSLDFAHRLSIVFL